LSKHLLIALMLIGVTVVVLLFNTNTITLELLVTSIRTSAALIYLGFTAAGVAIGLLLR